MRSLPELAAALAALLLLLASPRVALAHGVGQEVLPRGRGWAVRALYHHGKPLAGANYLVLRPGSEEVVGEGKTDPQGWVEFLPDAPGRWRVKIVDRTGHGKTVEVDVREVGGSSASPTPTATPTATPTPAPIPIPTPPPVPTTADDGSRPAGVLLAGAAIILLFLVLRRTLQRRGTPR